ncbi:MAG: hypothetical protein P4L27_08825, partial [Ignavibacteriaceae bacterium]|nr:hypothetical protein [Ignavibacteriaceae bacterium]
MAKERRIKDPPGSIRKEQSNSSEEKYPHSKKATGIYDRFIASTGLQLILIILLPLVIYFKVVNYNFILDDETIIKNNVTSLSQLNNIGEAFKRDAFFRAPGLSLYQVYRPMQTVSFILDALISGANPWMYHFTNLLLHVLTCIALYFFLQFLNLRKITAFLGTMIYSVHPLLAGNVSWISARGDLLIGLLSILLLLTMGYYYKTNKPILFILHVLIFLAAVFTKETIIVFPVIMLMFYFLFLKTKGTDKRIIKNRDKRIIKFAAAWILIDALYFAIKMGYFPENHPATVFGIPAFIKNLDSLPAILSKVFIPISLPLFPFFDTFSVTSGLIIIVLLIYAAILLYKKK